MMKYQTQSSAVMLICQVLLSTLFCDDSQKETGSGVTLDSVRKFYFPGMFGCSAKQYINIMCSYRKYPYLPHGFFQEPPLQKFQLSFLQFFKFWYRIPHP